MKQCRDAKLSFVKRESIALSKRLMDLKINKYDQQICESKIVMKHTGG